MIQTAEQNRRYTLDEYFEIEENTEYRNEYYDGYIYAMAGCSGNHSLISKNLIQHVNNLLVGKGCNAVGADLRVYIQSKNTYVYPDVMVVCGDFNYVKGRDDTITNPITVFEILSKSTQNYDLGDKFDAYRELESFEEYLVVDQYSVFVRHFQKIGQDEWKLHIYHKLEDVVELPTLNVKLPLAEIYEKIEFVPRPKRRIPGFLS